MFQQWFCIMLLRITETCGTHDIKLYGNLDVDVW